MKFKWLGNHIQYRTSTFFESLPGIEPIYGYPDSKVLGYAFYWLNFAAHIYKQPMRKILDNPTKNK